MSSYEELTPHGSGLIGSPLAGQLGTDPIDLARMKYDMSRLTVISQEMIGPIIYLEIRKKKIPAMQTVLDVIKNYSVSIGGRGRRDIIRMEAVSKGGMANVEAEMRASKPGLLARNVWRRDWDEKRREEAGL